MPIELKGVHSTYASGTAQARPVLRGVDLEVRRGECLGILGPIGSGKTTLVRHLNGLLLPERGTVRVGERILSPGTPLRRLLSSEVGVVFQFPEKQLFAETVFEDVAGGLRFAECPVDETGRRVAAALVRVGLDPREYGERPPFSLTWGEKRKVALAGVLALDTPRLVFDEPGAGLDPAGRKSLIGLIDDLVRREGRTVIVVSHHLDDLFRVADRLAILAAGRIIFEGRLEELCRRDDLSRHGLEWPPLISLMRTLKEGHPGLRTDVRTPEEAAAILETFRPPSIIQ
jgi:energy-coupling factor transport system ATP-binding protein